MKRPLKAMLVVVGLIGMGEISAMTEAVARPGGSNFMNSPGYQRRLQESRGYVTNRSNSVATSPFAKPRAYDRRFRRQR